MPCGFVEKTLRTTGWKPSSRSRLTAVEAGIPRTFASCTRATAGFGAGFAGAVGVTRATVTVVAGCESTVVPGVAFFLSSRLVNTTAATMPPITSTSSSRSHGQSSRSGAGSNGGRGGGVVPSSTTLVTAVSSGSRAPLVRRTTFMPVL
jgi:hypothetical protein